MTGIDTHESLLTTIRSSWDADAESYDSRPGHGLHSNEERQAWQRVLERLFEPLVRAGSLHIMDVGTGTGDMSLLLASMGFIVTGLDISLRMLDMARQKAQRAGVQLTLVEGRADRIPLPDGSVDAVFSRHLLWTLPNPQAALREWTRVVRPGGIVALADGWWDEPTREMRMRRAVGTAVRRLCEPGHAHGHPGYDAIRRQLPLAGGISPYSIRHLLDDAGLIRIAVRDLASIRRAERRSLPPWHWIDAPRHTWLASGYRPE